MLGMIWNLYIGIVIKILAGNLKKVNDDNIYDIYAKANKLIRF